MALLQLFHYYDYELADPRTRDWLLMPSVLYPTAISIVYLLLIYLVIPKYMENKKPYDLKKLIIAYNIYQIFTCAYIAHGMATSGWTTTYDFFCQNVDPTDSPDAIRIATLCWMLTLVKISEYIETFIFAFRKKYNQMSILHVYHHISAFYIGWMGTKYFPGGSYTFTPILNNSVHVIMYSYYLLSLVKISWLQNFLNKYKPYLTVVQMTQLTILVLYAIQMLRPSCVMPKFFMYPYIPIISLQIWLFYGFFKRSFLQKDKKE